ncbi:hypothetical protein Droror1_Dr00019165 [Drosera rotundifolia]
MANISSFVETIILVAAIVVSCIPTEVVGFGSASTTAISFRSKTICGILAGNVSQMIECYRGGKTFPIQPNISFGSLSGGGNFFCGLSSNGSSLYCWETNLYDQSFSPLMLYQNALFPLSDLAAGVSHVCAVQASTGRPLCWETSWSGFWFQKANSTATFEMITSGEGFTCGIVKSAARVLCWGGNVIGADIESQFGNATMLSLVAGISHACGLNSSGILICRGDNDLGQANAPPNTSFQFSGIALGTKHSCAILRSNGTVVCWGGGSGFATDGIQGIPFESIVAGWDFTCGLTRNNLTIVCWGPGWPLGSSSWKNTLTLPTVIPGQCVQGNCSCCGVYPGSDALCAKNTLICNSCESQLILPSQHKTPSVPKVTLAPSPTVSITVPSPHKVKYRPFWAYVIYGSLGILSGLLSLIYFIRAKRARTGVSQRRVQDSPGHDPATEDRDTAIVTHHNLSSLQSRSSSMAPSSWSLIKHLDRATFFSLADLVAATRNFSSEQKIGSGSFGKVYRGILADGREVAIKREVGSGKRKKSAHSENAFDSELALLSRVHHKHLVSLVGFCQEQDERLIVYNYMSNGSLHDHLHNIGIESSVVSSWKMRIKIALDAARGIEYLHNYAVPPIIHRDIKSSNILLDSDWTAKVSDLGLSLMRPESDQEDEEEHMESKAVGTVGYIDPEYYILRVLTTKSDVYGFGVVLLELLTGKKAVFKNSKSTSNPTGVVEYAGPSILAGEAWKVLDKRVGQPLQHECEAMEVVAYVALRCVNLEGKLRPGMTEVVATLERAFAICDNEDDVNTILSILPSVSFN